MDEAIRRVVSLTAMPMRFSPGSMPRIAARAGRAAANSGISSKGIEKQPSLRRVLALGQVGGFNQEMKHLLAAAALLSLRRLVRFRPRPLDRRSLGARSQLQRQRAARCERGGFDALYLLSIPDRGGGGEFCIATGCEDATYDLALTRSQGWAGTMRTQ
jgi:hypothetical protein